MECESVLLEVSTGCSYSKCTVTSSGTKAWEKTIHTVGDNGYRHPLAFTKNNMNLHRKALHLDAVLFAYCRLNIEKRT
jgi:hypothetical protein